MLKFFRIYKKPDFWEDKLRLMWTKIYVSDKNKIVYKRIID